MKRKIALGMILVMLPCVVLLSGFASADLPSAELSPEAVVCYPSCGPFTYVCSDVELDPEEGYHPVMVSGVIKTCVYDIYSAYTIRRCDSCGSRTASSTHSHGEGDHTYPVICGGSNARVCSLDGTEYNEHSDEHLME